MSERALGQIWTTLGLVSLYLSLNALLRVQGSEFFLPGFTFENAERYSTAVYGLLATLIPYCLLLRVTQVYAKLYRGQSWRSSIPVAFNLGVQPERRHGGTYQGVFFSLFLLAPQVFRTLLLRKILVRGGVYHRDSRRLVVSSVTQHLTCPFPIEVIWSNDYVFGSIEDGITYFPFWQSWLLMIIEVGFALYLLYIIQSIFWPGPVRRLSRLMRSV